ncbi:MULTISPECIES: hypothetical protein [Peribacillus]|uniref:hypothetical protein n=1 Tax=Peribacillus TaxID=2675229 RepID=UPI001F4E300B|nr:MULTISPECIES: hypothetical protein [unclassified Peribacillus]MCK1983708.1 hypothetical protein [Peribacillus sp. Aquil_B1]MCK2011397.1 hypothetical protein [Peribacillus sp. Aquil_B8]
MPASTSEETIADGIIIRITKEDGKEDHGNAERADGSRQYGYLELWPVHRDVATVIKKWKT